MDVTVGGSVYRLGKLNAFDQLDVMAWLTPLVGGLIGAMGAAGLEAPAEGPAAAVEGFKDFTSSIAGMPREVRRLCFMTLLQGANKIVAEGIPPVPIVEGGVLKDTTMSGPAILELSGRVFWLNLGDFIDALPSDWQDKVRKLAARLPG